MRPRYEGGEAVIGCSGIVQPYSGCGGRRRRILLKYKPASTADAIVNAAGGSWMCVEGGTGTVLDVQQTLRLRSSAFPISFIVVVQFSTDTIASVTPLPLSIGPQSARRRRSSACPTRPR